jgi:hypothetical protein
MKTDIELNQSIFKITMTIQNEFPELLKFLNEMNVTIPNKNSPQINTKILQEYYDSLHDLLSKYVYNHTTFNNNIIE